MTDGGLHIAFRVHMYLLAMHSYLDQSGRYPAYSCPPAPALKLEIPTLDRWNTVPCETKTGDPPNSGRVRQDAWSGFRGPFQKLVPRRQPGSRDDPHGSCGDAAVEITVTKAHSVQTMGAEPNDQRAGNF